MVTGSYYPGSENGFKIIEPDGRLLSKHWEKMVQHVANVEALSDTLVNLNELRVKGYFLGRDIFKLEKIPPFE